jgi:hypothetical protein
MYETHRKQQTNSLSERREVEIVSWYVDLPTEKVITHHANVDEALSDLMDDLGVQQFLTAKVRARLRRGQRVTIGKRDEAMVIRIRAAKGGK